VRQLARAVGIPEVIVQKPPSADLWKGQTDEGELGFTYAEVDKLLYLLVDQRYTPEDCVEAGFAESFVRAVVQRVRRNHFKRVLPPIAKLSNRTVGYDFLYLRDWGRRCFPSPCLPAAVQRQTFLWPAYGLRPLGRLCVTLAQAGRRLPSLGKGER